MQKDNRDDIYERLEKQNGRNNQVIKAIEEFAELIKELTKQLGKDTYTSTKNICEEIADARVCLEQLERFFDPNGIAVEIVIDYKLRRLEMFYLKADDTIDDDDLIFKSIDK
jgi:chromosome condensin MukBEF ATPase and DNA-binding subunit MukB